MIPKVAFQRKAIIKNQALRDPDIRRRSFDSNFITNLSPTTLTTCKFKKKLNN